MTEQDYFAQFLGDDPLPALWDAWEWPALTKAMFDQIVTGFRIPPEFWHEDERPSAMSTLSKPRFEQIMRDLNPPSAAPTCDEGLHRWVTDGPGPVHCFVCGKVRR